MNSLIKKEIKLELDKSIRIDKALSSVLDVSRSTVQHWLKLDLVLVNGVVVKANYKAQNGDQVSIIEEKQELVEIQPENIPLDIVYEDEELIVVNKPSGMVVHPSKGHYSGTLVNALLFHSNKLSDSNNEEIYRPGLVHRIDKDTSGLLVIAKTNEIHQALANQIQENKMNREYIAIVEGYFAHETGVIDAPLARHQSNRLKRVVTKNGKNAITHFKVLETVSDYSLISCRLETGRTHQIRAHMEYIKHPIINDPLYHPKGKNATKFGQYLHAKTLKFAHPKTKEMMTFSVEPPKEFNDFLKAYRDK